MNLNLDFLKQIFTRKNRETVTYNINFCNQSIHLLTSSYNINLFVSKKFCFLIWFMFYCTRFFLLRHRWHMSVGPLILSIKLLLFFIRFVLKIVIKIHSHLMVLFKGLPELIISDISQIEHPSRNKPIFFWKFLNQFFFFENYFKNYIYIFYKTYYGV